MDLQRRLTFFKWRSVEDRPPFDLAAAAEAVQLLPDDNERPLRRSDVSVDVSIHGIGDDKRPTTLTIERLRSFEERPWARGPGELAAPTSMRPDQHLLDFTHVAIWPDGYAAFSLGGYAPSPNALVDFLFARASQTMALVPLYEQDLVEKLKQWKGVRGVSFAIENSQPKQTALNATKGAFSGLFDQIFGQAESVILRAEVAVPSRGKGARQRILGLPVDDVIELAALGESFDQLRVSGLTAAGRIEQFDLVTQRLQIICKLPRAAAGGHRTDDAATFQALIDARATVVADGRLARAAMASPP